MASLLPVIVGLSAFFLATKLLVRWWWFRPVYVRPGFVRHNESLRMLDLLAVLALLGTFFMLINSLGLLPAILLTAGLLGYDLALRAVFLHLETKRMCSGSSRWTYRQARRRVQSRARSSSAL